MKSWLFFKTFLQCLTYLIGLRRILPRNIRLESVNLKPGELMFTIHRNQIQDTCKYLFVFIEPIFRLLCHLVGFRRIPITPRRSHDRFSLVDRFSGDVRSINDVKIRLF